VRRNHGIGRRAQADDAQVDDADAQVDDADAQVDHAQVDHGLVGTTGDRRPRPRDPG